MSPCEKGAWRPPTIPVGSCPVALPLHRPPARGCMPLTTRPPLPLLPITVRAPSHCIRACDRPWIFLPPSPAVSRHLPLSPARLRHPSLIPPWTFVVGGARLLFPCGACGGYTYELGGVAPCPCVAPFSHRAMRMWAVCVGVFVGFRRPVERRSRAHRTRPRGSFDSSRTCTSRDAPLVSCVGESAPSHVVLYWRPDTGN
jgi:hypothetical protein